MLAFQPHSFAYIDSLGPGPGISIVKRMQSYDAAFKGGDAGSQRIKRANGRHVSRLKPLPTTRLRKTSCSRSLGVRLPHRFGAWQCSETPVQDDENKKGKESTAAYLLKQKCHAVTNFPGTPPSAERENKWKYES